MILIEVLKEIGGPGSIGFLAAGCAVGLMFIYVWPRRRALGRAWLFGLYVSYIVLGLPLVAHRVAEPFNGIRPLRTLDSLRPLDVLMVFGGDNSVARVRETVRVWNEVSPSVVIVSGEDWFIERLVDAGVPSDRITQDRSSGTTREQVRYVQRYLEDHRDSRMAVIASRLQVPRVKGLLDAAELDVALVPSAADREPTDRGVGLYVPTYAALRITRDALYERVALAYYRRQGWIVDRDPAQHESVWQP